MKHYAVYRGTVIVNDWHTKDRAIYPSFQKAVAYRDEMNESSSGYYVAEYTPKKQRKTEVKK
jgi:hypothetical protein